MCICLWLETFKGLLLKTTDFIVYLTHWKGNLTLVSVFRLQGVSNGQGDTLRDKAYFYQPERLLPDSLCFQNSRLRDAFCEKTRLWDPRNLTEMLWDFDFLRGPFDIPVLPLLQRKLASSAHVHVYSYVICHYYYLKIKVHITLITVIMKMYSM